MIEPLFNSLSKGPLSIIWKDLDEKDLRNLRIAFPLNPKLCETALTALKAIQANSRLPEKIYQEFDRCWKESNVVENATWAVQVGKACAFYLRSGCNARERCAAVQDNPKITRWLPLKVLQQFSNWEEKSQKLIEYARGRSIANVRDELGKEGVWIDSLNDRGFSALDMAICFGHLDVVKLLLENGADLNVGNSLRDAARHGHLDVVKLLIERGADVNAVSDEGETALKSALGNKTAWEWRDGYMFVEPNREMVEFLLKKGADVHAVSEGFPLLCTTAFHGHTEMVKLLLDSGADVNAVNVGGRTALMTLANQPEFSHKKGQMQAYIRVAECLLKNGANVDIIDKDDRSALHLAVKNHVFCLVPLLLKDSADVNAVDKQGRTALIELASQHGLHDSKERMQAYIHVANCLVKKGAKVDIIDKDGYSALHRAVKNHFFCLVSLLLENGAAVNTALCAGEKKYPGSWEELLYRQIMDFCDRNIGLAPENFVAAGKLLKGLDLVNAADDRGNTPLHKAIISGNKRLARVLFSGGAHIEAADDRGYTALHKAAYRGRQGMVTMLLKHGADINATDKLGDSALTWAVRKGRAGTVTLLLAAGADHKAAYKVANQSDREDIVALFHHAIEEEWRRKVAAENKEEEANDEIIVLDSPENDLANMPDLVEANDAVDPIVEAGLAEAEEFLRLIGDNEQAERLANRADRSSRVNFVDSEKNGATFLHQATVHGFTKFAKMLIQQGADLKAVTKDGVTILSLVVKRAAATGVTEILELLLDRGADVNERDGDGWTPLHWAVYRGSVKVTELLLQHKPEIDATTREGHTALMGAAARGREDLVRRLLDAGAYPHNGDTALDIARDKYAKVASALSPNRRSWRIPAILLLLGAVLMIAAHRMWKSPVPIKRLLGAA